MSRVLGAFRVHIVGPQEVFESILWLRNSIENLVVSRVLGAFRVHIVGPQEVFQSILW